MTNLMRKPLPAAIAAATLAMAATSASATSVVIPPPESDPTIPIVGAFSPDDSGDTLLFPFFSAVGETTTAFSITNTSDVAIAVKVRFREQQYSMETWDTYVFLSPYDKFDFSVGASAADPNVPEVRVPAAEDTCSTVTSFPSAFQNSDFNTVGKENGRWTVGHLEVIGVANLSIAEVRAGGTIVNLGAASELKDQPIVGGGGITGCEVLRQVAQSDANLGQVDFDLDDVDADFGDAPNALIGRYLVSGGPDSGIEAATTPIVIRDTFTRSVAVAQSGALCTQSVIPLELPFGGENPDPERGQQRCSQAYAWDAQQEAHPHLGDMLALGYYAIDEALEAIALQGDWSNNSANNVGTDHIVSFPTRYVYTDTNANGTAWFDVLPPFRRANQVPPELTSIGRIPGPNVGGLNPFNGTIGSSADDMRRVCSTADGEACEVTRAPRACLPLQPMGWDFDEGISYDPVSPSTSISLCNEVTVVSVAGDLDPLPDSILQQNSGPYSRVPLVFGDLMSPRGWAQHTLLWPNASAPIGGPAPIDNLNGAATYGAVFMLRNVSGLPSVNNGSLAPLARDIEQKEAGQL